MSRDGFDASLGHLCRLDQLAGLLDDPVDSLSSVEKRGFPKVDADQASDLLLPIFR
jgi:hypothetical protein